MLTLSVSSECQLSATSSRVRLKEELGFSIRQLMYSSGFGHRLGCEAIGQDTSYQLCIAILFVSDELAFLEVDDEYVVVVVALAVAGKVLPFGLHNDDIASIDHTVWNGSAFNEDAVQR